MRWIAGMLAGLLLLQGCGAAPLATSSTSSATTVAIRITLAGGRADPNGERVPISKGTTLVLTITSDHDDEVHVHGYDVEIPVSAGTTVTREILLDQVGRFEVESHEPQLTVLELTVS